MNQITQTTEILAGWSRLPGLAGFHMIRIRDGLEAVIAGRRGAWDWRVDRRLPPDFKAELVAQGRATSQHQAKLDAQAAMTAAREA